MATAPDNILTYLRERMDVVVDRVAEVNKSISILKTTLDDHIAKEGDQEQNLARLTEVLCKNTETLQEHVRRTDMLEGYVKTIDARLTPVEAEQLRKKMVHTWITSKLRLVAKIGAAASAVGALGLAIKHLSDILSWFH